MTTWSFEVEGQPISWNAGYEIGKVTRTGRRGRLRLSDFGEPVEARTIVKTAEAKAYTEKVAWLAKTARPSGWAPTGFVIVEFDFYLGRNIDCDNVMKFIDDGLQQGTGVDDKWYLPRAMSKQIGLRPTERKVVVRVTG